MEQWNSESGTVWWNNEIVKVEQCGGTVEQCWWNNGRVMVKKCGEHWNSVGGVMEQCWWNSESETVEQ